MSSGEDGEDVDVRSIFRGRATKVAFSTAVLFLGAATISGLPALAEDGVVAPPTISERVIPVLNVPKQRRTKAKATSKPKAKSVAPVEVRAPVKAVVVQASPVKLAAKKKVVKKKAVAKVKRYTCAGLDGDDLESVFGAEVAYQGDGGDYECSLSRFDGTAGVIVSKLDKRAFSFFTPKEGDTQENYGKDAISWTVQNETYLSILMRGGREVTVWAPDIDKARRVADVVVTKWVKLTPEQLAAISGGSCSGANGSEITAENLSPHAFDVILQSTSNDPDEAGWSILYSEGQDFRLTPLESDLTADGWDPTIWTPLGIKGGTGYVSHNEAEGSERMYVQSPTFGGIRLDARSQNFGNKFGGYARFYTYAEQDKFLRGLATKLMNS
jgi:hypothetical protein